MVRAEMLGFNHAKKIVKIPTYVLRQEKFGVTKILNKWRNVTTALNLSSSTNGKIFVKSGVKVTTDKNDTL